MAPLLALAWLPACAQDSPVTPADIRSQMGRTPAAPPVVLQEYWVVPCLAQPTLETPTPCPGTAGSGWLLHLVGSGSVTSIGKVVHWDYFHNGEADDDYSDHFEYGGYSSEMFAAPPANLLPAPAAGLFHADLYWDGHSTPTEYFPDFLAKGADKADPYVFKFSFWNKTTRLSWIPPKGVILNGEYQGAASSSEISSAYHPEASVVTSFALYKGAAPAVGAGVKEFTISEVTCRVQQRRKSAPYTLVSARFKGRIAKVDGSPANELWAELHLQNGEGGTLTWRNSVNADFDTFDFVVSREYPAALGDKLELYGVMDYLYNSGVPEDREWVYDPGLNSNDGFTTTWEFTAPRELEAHPVVRTSTAVPVTCN